MDEVLLDQPINVVDLIHGQGLVRSKSEGRRLVKASAVKLDGRPIGSIGLVIELAGGEERVLQVGRRRFLRLLSARP